MNKLLQEIKDKYRIIADQVSDDLGADIDLSVNYINDTIVVSVRRSKNGEQWYDTMGVSGQLLTENDLFKDTLTKFVTSDEYSKKDDGWSVSHDDLVKARDFLLPYCRGHFTKDFEFDIHVDFFTHELIIKGWSFSKKYLASWKMSPSAVKNIVSRQHVEDFKVAFTSMKDEMEKAKKAEKPKTVSSEVVEAGFEPGDFTANDTGWPEPSAFIQWKGTNVCMDFHCECGVLCHFDGDFAYAVKCPHCETIWEMPSVIYPRKASDKTYQPHVEAAKMLEPDIDFEEVV